MKADIINKFIVKREDIGISIGKSIGRKQFKHNINRMIEAVDKNYGINFEKLESESMLWLESIPEEYQKELVGIAQGADLSIKQIAQWYYSSMSIDGGCTSFITKIDNSWWVGRNNDYLLPKAWGHINIIEVEGKIPVMLFGLEGDIFSGTGFNKEKLWLHYNWLPVWDLSEKSKNTLTPFIFIRKALENCSSVEDVKQLLKSTVRDGGMNLFVIDGKNNQSAVFECSSKNYKERKIECSYLAGANHYAAAEVPADFNFNFDNSIKRQNRVEKLLLEQKDSISTRNMIDILADSKVEQNNNLSGTVYSNIACPAENLIYFAYDGYPAASRSKWQKIEWDW
ncbi:acyl-CoA:6-aminopenicillanic acid acyl transferase [Halanaerobium saccharolyticum]|uniref:Acyl-CoA:6-aminopenicillanic acid acyl transferase n=1 Tax=Halanaerobium saccharolyticum TaxID=43595 RepID=A0A4R6RQF5_9FIRM|nr:C45 family peptidase [Halanaerobium saccharolyticum]TDP88950.1 acyl-CoA:6-aminopenicillanic acid acyl transferase [Halanaerobium saccharolyticum]